MIRGVLNGTERPFEIEYLLSEMYKHMESKRYVSNKSETFVVVDTLVIYDGDKYYLSVVYCPEYNGIMNRSIRFSSKLYEFLEKFSEVK